MSKKSKKEMKLSDIKFDKNKVISDEKLKKILKSLDAELKKTEEQRSISDYSKLHVPIGR